MLKEIQEKVMIITLKSILSNLVQANKTDNTRRLFRVPEMIENNHLIVEAKPRENDEQEGPEECKHNTSMTDSARYVDDKCS
jgi:predicted proteasome-type protease